MTERWAEQMARVEEKRNACNCLRGNLSERNQLVILDTDVRITLTCTFKKQWGSGWTRFIWLVTGTSGELLRTRKLIFGF
jgi:hypothetical protein